MKEKFSWQPLRSRFIQCVFLSVALLTVAESGSAEHPILSGANAERLKTGRFLYRTVVNGKDAGTAEISISKLRPDILMFANHISGAFAQQWEAVANVMFVPLSAKLTFGEDDKLRPQFELDYREGHATGWRLERSTSNKIDIDVKVRPDTIDQRIDWAAAISQELVPGREFTFSVFDPVTQISRVTGRVVDLETIEVPAGTFAAARVTYSIEKSRGTETYQVLTNSTGPRILLKEEFPNGAIAELLRVN